jgi:hypothetical protein
MLLLVTVTFTKVVMVAILPRPKEEAANNEQHSWDRGPSARPPPSQHSFLLLLLLTMGLRAETRHG